MASLFLHLKIQHQMKKHPCTKSLDLLAKSTAAHEHIGLYIALALSS